MTYSQNIMPTLAASFAAATAFLAAPLEAEADKPKPGSYTDPAGMITGSTLGFGLGVTPTDDGSFNARFHAMWRGGSFVGHVGDNHNVGIYPEFFHYRATVGSDYATHTFGGALSAFASVYWGETEYTHSLKLLLSFGAEGGISIPRIRQADQHTVGGPNLGAQLAYRFGRLSVGCGPDVSFYVGKDYTPDAKAQWRSFPAYFGCEILYRLAPE